MAAWNSQANDIFLQAFEVTSADLRREYLDKACGGDAELRAQVDSLLAAHSQAGSFLESPTPRVAATVDQPPAERPGTQIGPYKLLQQIGEGGMGTVYMAEQSHPVQRKVALKVIKAGMDSRQIIARFEAERQALAVMDHVNIARVLDAGTTESGLPYFVMELVHGVPITKYCDDSQLTLRERLELFVPVCQAIQHAHQKGIIHRDIKPSNVMVTLYDGKPVPKVIDFGVAKATEQKLTERTLFTQYGTLVGTLEYMSPEQAEMSGLGVDTRSDIFSLGVLLYELLTGSTPLSIKRMKEAAYAEVLRMIKEEEPPKPSTRLSESGEALASISAQRHTEPAKLSKLMRGDLDWIVMKTLEKDRNRRYETANGFAADVQRYLNDEPVQACPPSAGYRLRKFARRNRGPVLAVSLVALALVGGIIGTTWGMLRATDAEAAAVAETLEKEKTRAQAVEQRDRAEKAEQAAKGDRDRAVAAEADTQAFSNFLVDHVLAVPRPEGLAGGLGIDVTVAQALEAAEETFESVFAGRPKAEAVARSSIGVTWRTLGRYAKAEEHLRRALTLFEQELGPDAAATLTTGIHLAHTLTSAGRGGEAVPLCEEMLKRLNATAGSDHRSTLVSMSNLAEAYRTAGRPAEAIPLLELTLQKQRTILGLDHPDTLTGMNNLALAYMNTGQLDKALPLFEQTLEKWRGKLGPGHPDMVNSMNNLAGAFRDAGHWDKAVLLYKEALEKRKVQLGPGHPDTFSSMHNLGHTYAATERIAEAVPLLEEALKGLTAKLGLDHLQTQNAQQSLKLARLLEQRSDAYQQASAAKGADDRDTLSRRMQLALVLQNLKNLPLAEDHLRAVFEAGRRILGPEDSLTLASQIELARNQLLRQKYAEAEPQLRESLMIQENKQPDAWVRFNVSSLLGCSLLGQKKYAEAEPLLLAGYEGLKQREATIPSRSQGCLRTAVERLAQLFDATGKTDEAAKWRDELEKVQAARLQNPPAQSASLPGPALLTPERGATLDNGLVDRSLSMVREFKWSEIPGATKYHLIVFGPSSDRPSTELPNLSSPTHRYEIKGYVLDKYRLGWRWKVRALVNGVWTDWSEERIFNVAPLNRKTSSGTVRQ